MASLRCNKPFQIRRKTKVKFFDFSEFHYVPCGRCVPCLEKKRLMWSIRLLEESKDWKYSSFITLTYDDYHVEEVNKKRLQNYFRYLRRDGLEFKYFAVAEYGTTTQRPHYHVVFFGIHKDEPKLHKHWPYGHVHRGSFSMASAMYTTKYHTLSLAQKIGTFTLSSQLLGIGYVSRMRDWHRNDLMNRYYYPYHQFRLPLPRYFADKIYSSRQKQQISFEFDDKHIHWDSPQFEDYEKKYKKEDLFGDYARYIHSLERNTIRDFQNKSKHNQKI